MSQLPYPLPGKYDPSGPFRNPGVTNPLPAPADIPSPCWFGGNVPVSWTDVSAVDPDVQLQYEWRSPIFDMRPDLRNVIPDVIGDGRGGTAGQPTRLGAQPMWNRAAQLWIQAEDPNSEPGPALPAIPGGGIGARNLVGLQVLATEVVHVSDPNRISPISQPEDVTAQFMTGAAAAILSWYPIGDANPARFYQLRLTFNMLKEYRAPEPTVAQAPRMTLVPAMY